MMDDATKVMRQRASFAAFLTRHMIDAITDDDNDLDWRDAILSAAHAIRLVSNVAQLMTSKDEMREVSLEEIDGIVDELIAKGRAIQVVLKEVTSQQEMDEFLSDIDNAAPDNLERRH